MSNLESPQPSPAHLSPEKPSETESFEPIMDRTIGSSSSTDDHQPDDGHARIMENFKGMIFKFAISSSPTKSLSPMLRSIVEKQLDEIFPSFRTPVHPPYTAMIESAIRELGDEGGSSEEGISRFIRKEYPNLPWAHDALLKHNLGHLCEDGSIIKTYNGLYMFQEVVTNQGSSSAHSRSFNIDAYSRFRLSPDSSPGSSSMSDNSSYCSSPRLKRKRQMYSRRSKKKQGRRKWSGNQRSARGKAKRTVGARVAKRRSRRLLKQYVSEDDTEASDELLMLHLMSEGTEDDNKSEEECSDGAESIEEVSRKRQKIMKRGQRPETGLVIEIQTDNHEDLVDEGQREPKTRGAKGKTAQRRSRCVPIRRRRPCNKIFSEEKTQLSSEEIETDIQYSKKSKVSKEKYRIDKEAANGANSQDQVQENTHGALESSHTEDICAVGDIGKSERIRECSSVMEVVPEKDEGVKECDEQNQHDNFIGIEEQCQVEEHNAVPHQEHSTGKRRGRPHKNGVKQRKVEMNPKGKPGRPKGRPRKRDLSVEKAQPKEQQIQDLVLEEITDLPVSKNDTNKEVTEVVEEHNQSQGNLCTLERSPSGEIKLVMKIEKFKEDENKIRKQFGLVTEGVPESDEAAKGCDAHKELKTFIGSEGETKFEETIWGPKHDQRNQQKGRGMLLNKGAKARELHKKHSPVPGRTRGRQHKKDILVERTETKGEQGETTDSHEVMFKENTELPRENREINKESTKEFEDCGELYGNMHGTPEWSLVKKTNIGKEDRKPGPDAEENIQIKVDCCKMEGQKQDTSGIKWFNEEPENKFDEEQKKSTKEMNEITCEGNQQRRHENEAQNLQLEEGVKACCILDGEEQQGAGVKGFNGKNESGDAFDEEQDYSAKEKNDATVGENLRQREENEEQNQLKKEDLKDYCMTEGEEQWDCNVKGSNMKKEAGNAFNEDKEDGKPESDVEENIQIKVDCCKMEGQQQHHGIKEFNGQKELENKFNEKQKKSDKEMNEITCEHENEAQNLQLEEGLKDCCILEGEDQQGSGVKGFNGRNESGDAFDEVQDFSAKGKNEVTTEENLQKREENDEQNQLKKEDLKDCCMTEGEKQRDCNVKGSNMQNEAGNTFDEEKNQFSEENSEMTFEENQQKRPEYKEQNQQHEDGLKSVTEQEIELSGMFCHDIQILENIQLERECDSITKSLLLEDIAERRMEKKATVFPEQSFDSVGGKTISNGIMESDGRQAEVSEQKPESSTTGNFKLKWIERSSQPNNLLQQQHKVEKPVDGQLRTQSQKSKSYDLCSML